MRTIKFRGKRTDNGEWIIGDLIQQFNTRWVAICPIEDDIENFIEVINETVGQFTGVADKNEKEIYEGDIIQDEQSKYNEKYIVRWSVGNCGFVAQPQNQDKVYPNLNPGTTRHLIIIGNIHDNPEMLK